MNNQSLNKLVNIFRQILAAPQVLANPAMAKLFNQIIASSGLDPLDFSGLTKALPQPAQQPTGQPARSPELAVAK